MVKPSAIRQINEVMGESVHKVLVDRMLEKIEGKLAVEKNELRSSCCGLRWVAKVA